MLEISYSLMMNEFRADEDYCEQQISDFYEDGWIISVIAIVLI